MKEGIPISKEIETARRLRLASRQFRQRGDIVTAMQSADRHVTYSRYDTKKRKTNVPMLSRGIASSDIDPATLV